MPFLISVLLAPAGILLGTVLFFGTHMIIAGAPIPDARLLRDFAAVGAVVGSIVAAPISLVALPLACGILRRRGQLSPIPLAITGALAGCVSVLGILVIIVVSQNLKGTFQPSPWFFGLLADTAFCGAVCGALLAVILRRLRPAG